MPQNKDCWTFITHRNYRNLWSSQKASIRYRKLKCADSNVAAFSQVASPLTARPITARWIEGGEGVLGAGQGQARAGPTRPYRAEFSVCLPMLCVGVVCVDRSSGCYLKVFGLFRPLWSECIIFRVCYILTRFHTVLSAFTSVSDFEVRSWLCCGSLRSFLDSKWMQCGFR